MKTLHISLVGGQKMPVYVGIESSLAKEVVLIHSSKSYADANTIKEVLSDRTVSLEPFDPINFPVIEKQVEKLMSRYVGYEKIEINISGGTKPWTIAFNRLSFVNDKIRILYIDQNCQCYNISEGCSQACNSVFETEKLLRLNGQSAKSYLRYCDLDEQDLSLIAKIEKLRKTNYIDFNALTITGKNPLFNRNKGEKSTDLGSYITWDKELNNIELTLVKKSGEQVTQVLSSPHVFALVFNAGWFEVKVAGMLSRWKPVKDVWLNVVFPFKDGAAKNEIDVIVNVGNKMLFVECKTQIKELTDIDKFNSSTKNYGGLSCKSLFITDAVMKDGAVEKCGNFGIMPFSLQQSGIFASVEENLFFGLDRFIFDTNTK